MDSFLSVNLGNLLTIFAFLVGGLSFVYTIKGDVRLTGIRISNIEEEMSELRKVVVTMARQEERISSMDQRLLSQGQRIDAQGQRITSLDQRVFKLQN